MLYLFSMMSPSTLVRLLLHGSGRSYIQESTGRENLDRTPKHTHLIIPKPQSARVECLFCKASNFRRYMDSNTGTLGPKDLLCAPITPYTFFKGLRSMGPHFGLWFPIFLLGIMNHCERPLPKPPAPVTKGPAVPWDERPGRLDEAEKQNERLPYGYKSHHFSRLLF